MSRIGEDGRKWLRRQKLCTKICRALLRIYIYIYIYIYVCVCVCVCVCVEIRTLLQASICFKSAVKT